MVFAKMSEQQEKGKWQMPGAGVQLPGTPVMQIPRSPSSGKEEEPAAEEGQGTSAGTEQKSSSAASPGAATMFTDALDRPPTEPGDWAVYGKMRASEMVKMIYQSVTVGRFPLEKVAVVLKEMSVPPELRKQHPARALAFQQGKPQPRTTPPPRRTTSAGPPFCRYFPQGTCRKGKDCTFQHVRQHDQFPAARGQPQQEQRGRQQQGAPRQEQRGRQQQGAPRPTPGACSFFKKGNCKFGADCKFSHQLDFQQQRGNSAQPPRRINTNGDVRITVLRVCANQGKEENWGFHDTEMLPDSGAETNLVGARTIEALKARHKDLVQFEEIQGKGKSFVHGLSEKLELQQKIALVTLPALAVQVELHVVEEDVPMIIGLPTLKSLSMRWLVGREGESLTLAGVPLALRKIGKLSAFDITALPLTGNGKWERMDNVKKK
jgi:hypothetical protein